ncbi:MAG: GNAT family N-acetyltransferase [Bacteroidales bacterium]
MIFTLRPATQEDLSVLLAIIREAQENFRLAGINQWQNGYPNSDVIRQDIENGHSFVLTRENEIIATAMISAAGEPTYREIDGKWLTDGPYIVIHRLAVRHAEKGKSIAARIISLVAGQYISKGFKSIRIDTHQDNIAMQRAAEKAGFRYCGIITLTDGALRRAYEMIF